MEPCSRACRICNFCTSRRNGSFLPFNHSTQIHCLLSFPFVSRAIYGIDSEEEKLCFRQLNMGSKPSPDDMFNTSRPAHNVSCSTARTNQPQRPAKKGQCDGRCPSLGTFGRPEGFEAVPWRARSLEDQDWCWKGLIKTTGSQLAGSFSASEEPTPQSPSRWLWGDPGAQRSRASEQTRRG